MDIKNTVASPQDMAFLLMPSIKGAEKAKKVFEGKSSPLKLYKSGATLTLESYITAVALAFIPTQMSLFTNGISLPNLVSLKKDKTRLNVFKKAFLNDVFDSLETYYNLTGFDDFSFNVITSDTDGVTRNLNLVKKTLNSEMEIYRNKSLISTSEEFRSFVFKMRSPIKKDAKVTNILALMFVLSKDKDEDNFYNYISDRRDTVGI